jgi:hypothetical protein
VCARRRQSNLLVVRFGFQPVAFQKPTVAFHRTPGWVASTKQRPQMRLIRTFSVFATLQASHMAFGYLFHRTEKYNVTSQ